MSDNSNKKYKNYTEVMGSTIPGAGYIDSAPGDEYSIEDMEQHLLDRKVLSAKKIDKTSFVSNLSHTIEEIDDRMEKVNEAISSIDRDLSETNSARFYSDTEAVEQREKLAKMQAQLIELSSKLHSMDDGSIESKIDEYNDALPRLKKGEEMKLMMEQADKINANKRQVGYPYDPQRFVRCSTKPQTKTVQNPDKVTITETSYKWTKTITIGENEYKEIETIYEHIDYSDLISGSVESLAWPWNIDSDDVIKFQSRITSLGYTLYYNPKSVNYDE